MTEYVMVKTTHRLYRIWTGMKFRCDSPRYEKYHRYGGRGITYDISWKDFEIFVADMYPSYIEGLTLDRINNDGNYSKDNCQWATRQVNSKKDTSKGMCKYTLEGVFLERFEAMSDACVSLGLSKNHGGLNRAHKQQKPFKGFRWARNGDDLDLFPDEMKGTLINTNVKIAQIDLKNSKLIKIWDSAKDASDTLKISNASMSQARTGKRKSAGGFGWMNIEIPELSKV